jgi:hypothetical protein
MYQYPCLSVDTLHGRLLGETRAIFSFSLRNEMIPGHPCIPSAASFEPVAHDGDEQSRTRWV